MSAKKTVQEFLEASAEDVANARHLLADDLVWEFNGTVQTTSADEFIARQRADVESGSAETEVETLVCEGEELVAIGWIAFTSEGDSQSTMRMRMAEAFQVSGGRITSIRDVFAAV